MLGSDINGLLSDIQGLGAMMRIGRIIERRPELGEQIKESSRKLASNLCNIPIESITEETPPTPPDSIARLKQYRLHVGEMWEDIKSNPNLEGMCNKWWQERVVDAVKQICDDTHKVFADAGEDVSLDDVKCAFRVLLKDIL
jgi:hypothetical protein